MKKFFGIFGVMVLVWGAAVVWGQTVSINGNRVMRGLVGAPANGQIAAWNSTTKQWEPVANGAGTGGNWAAVGTTNSSLAGGATVNYLTATGAVTAGSANIGTGSAAALISLANGGVITNAANAVALTNSLPVTFQSNVTATASITASGGGTLSGGFTVVTPTIASFVNATHAHQNAAGGGALDAAAVTSGVFAIGRLATGTPDGTKFVRDDGTLAEPAGGGGGLGYEKKFGGADTSFNPSSGGFTLYSGGSVYGVPSTSFTNQCVPIMKSGTIKVIWVRVRDDGTLGSSENVTFKISINGAAGSGTGVVMPISAINNLGTSTGESIAVTAGQAIALTFTTPTWATPPTFCYIESGVYIE